MEYVLSVLVLMGIYVILSSSFNLIIGYGGLISIAHPIFFALGAYTTGVLSVNTSIWPTLAIALGGLVALVFSLMLSLPSLRISGDYLLITSIGFQLGFLGGASGLGNIPNVVEGDARSVVFALISIGMAVLVFLFIRWLIRGPYGLLVSAMRDDELVYTSLGRNAMKVKLVIFAIGSSCAGLAGGLYAYYYQYVNPDQFEILQSSMILTMVVVGGMGSQWGPVVGTVLLLFLPQAIGFLNFPPGVMAPLQGLLYSLLVIIFLFVRPQGLVASLERNTAKSAP